MKNLPEVTVTVAVVSISISVRISIITSIWVSIVSVPCVSFRCSLRFSLSLSLPLDCMMGNSQNSSIGMDSYLSWNNNFVGYESSMNSVFSFDHSCGKRMSIDCRMSIDKCRCSCSILGSLSRL